MNHKPTEHSHAVETEDTFMHPKGNDSPVGIRKLGEIEFKADFDIRPKCVRCGRKHMIEIDCMVDHPAHYGGEKNPYEHVKVMRAWGLVSNAFLYQCTKYICRLGKKGGAPSLQDLKKARWYLDQAIIDQEEQDKKELEQYQKSQELAAFATARIHGKLSEEDYQEAVRCVNERYPE